MSSKNPSPLFMKMHQYEEFSRMYIDTTKPYVIRVDGNQFKKFTKGLKYPEDKIFRGAMQDTMLYMVQHAANCKMGYTHSDEISLLCVPSNTGSFGVEYNGRTDKLCSISASRAASVFKDAFCRRADDYIRSKEQLYADGYPDTKEAREDQQYIKTLIEKKSWFIVFDCRILNVDTLHDLVLYAVWRQTDAANNSVMMLAYSELPKEEIFGVTRIGLINKLKSKGVDWNARTSAYKWGVCAVPYNTETDEHTPDGVATGNKVVRIEWKINASIPYSLKDSGYFSNVLGDKSRYDKV